MYILLLFSLLVNIITGDLVAMNLPARVLIKGSDQRTVTIDKKHFSDAFLKKYSAQILSGSSLTVSYPSSLINAACSTLITYRKTKNIHTTIYDKTITELFRKLQLAVNPFDLQQVNHYLKILKWLMPPQECIDHVVSLCARLTKTQSYKEFYKQFSTENLEPLVSQGPTISLEDQEENPVQRDFVAEINRYLTMLLSPDAFTKRQAALRLVAAYKTHEEDSLISKVLDVQSRRDCELLCGPKSSPLSSVAAKIDRTSTEVGKVLFYEKLSQPTSNCDQLRLIKQKVEHLKASPYYDKFRRLLKKLKDEQCENSILSLWSEDVFYHYLKYQEVNIHRWKELSAWFNTNECFLEVTQETSLLALRIKNKLSKAAVSISFKIGDILGISENEDVKDIVTLVADPLTQQVLPFLLTAYGGAYAPVAYLLPLLSTKHEEALAQTICIHLAMQKNLKNMARYLHTIRKIQALLKEVFQQRVKVGNNYQVTPVRLSEDFPLLDSLDLTARNTQEPFLSRLWSKAATVDNFNDLLGILETSLFKAQKPSESYPGRVIAAYRLVHKYKKELSPIIVALGEFDMYMSIAQLSQEKYIPHEEAYALFNKIMVENQHMLSDIFSSSKLDSLVDDEMKKYVSENETTFCFPELLNAQEPVIAFEGFWNPLVHTPGKNFVRKTETTTAVINSLELGDTCPRNVIITGPNGGGKSTIMKAALLAVILAQSIGIAPAQFMKFTPFSKICAYLNITDDTAAGASLFNAAALRAAKLLHKVETMPEGQMSLTVFDELFNGTSPREGQALAYALIKEIGTKLHNICILTTHFHYITKLEQEDADTFVNYQVSAHVDRIGNHAQIEYPYKLEPGISRQCIAFHVLRSKGFKKRLLQEAERVLQELDDLEEALQAPQGAQNNEHVSEVVEQEETQEDFYKVEEAEEYKEAQLALDEEEDRILQERLQALRRT